MAEDRRQHVRIRAVHEVQIAMTHAGRLRADQDLTGPGFGDLDFFDF